jgi:hypothetical protein
VTKFLFAVVVTLVFGGPIVAHARVEKPIPIEFVGEWYFASPENRDTEYKLSSWNDDGHCTKILSIDPYGFYDEAQSCQAMKVRPTHDTAPSGTAYMAIVTARCNPMGAVINSPQQVTTTTFEFDRYKGNLTVKPAETRLPYKDRCDLHACRGE